MSKQITLPNLGENIESGDVLTIFVSEGEQITADQDLIELETDKATVPVPSPEAGRVVKILVSEGETVPIGAPIIELEPAAGSDAAAGQAAAAPQTAPPPPPAEPPPESPPPPAVSAPLPPAAPPAPTPPTAPIAPTSPAASASPVGTELPPADAADDDLPGDGRAASHAGPAVRRLARQLGVDLRRVRPSGEGGRITADDVQAHVRDSNLRDRENRTTAVQPPGTPDSDGFGGVRIEKMSRLRQTIARNMTASYTSIPQLTNFDDVDITELEKIRQESKSDYAASGVSLTTMPFIIKAVASALKSHPIINASVDIEKNQIVYKEYVNIGIAVDTERGLVVPVLRDADRLNIPQIAHALAEIAEKARSGSIALDDLQGGTFTISNLGAVGGTYSTPIINPPEVAILLAGRSHTQPLFVDDQLMPRLVLPLSITYDHRVVDGAAAARFLNDVKGFLRAPGRLLLAP